MKLSGLNRFAQTQAIVAQVEREIAHSARSPRPVERIGTELMLLSPVNAGPSLPARAIAWSRRLGSLT